MYETYAYMHKNQIYKHTYEDHETYRHHICFWMQYRTHKNKRSDLLWKSILHTYIHSKIHTYIHEGHESMQHMGSEFFYEHARGKRPNLFCTAYYMSDAPRSTCIRGAVCVGAKVMLKQMESRERERDVSMGYIIHAHSKSGEQTEKCMLWLSTMTTLPPLAVRILTSCSPIPWDAPVTTKTDPLMGSEPRCRSLYMNQPAKAIIEACGKRAQEV
jgi:hypothetical protein